MEFIAPDWPAPNNINAFTTTVQGGFSKGAFASNNLGLHVGDNPDDVAKNRQQLHSVIGQDKSILWLNQIHSAIIIQSDSYHGIADGDASISKDATKVPAIMTADCLPVLICNQSGTQVAALHCGWRGLYQGLISKVLQSFDVKDALVWLGPAISQPYYEVDTPFYQRFVDKDPIFKVAFQAARLGHFYCDLYQLAKIELQQNGIETVYGGEFCTFSDERFYSYRRNPKTGRQVSIIGFD